MELKNISVTKSGDFNFLLFTEENYVIYYNIDSDEYFIVEHDQKILYTWDNYYSDTDKNIYEVDFGKFVCSTAKKSFSNKIIVRGLKSLLDDSNGVVVYKHPEVTRFTKKVRKNLFKAVGKYLIDTFGDCLANGNTRLTGTLCGVVDCCATSRFVILADKYKRIRIVNLQGRIERFIFVSSPIYKVVSTEEKLFVLTKDTFEIFNIMSGEQLSIKEMKNSEEDKLLLVSNEIYFVKEASLMDINHNILESNGVFVSTPETIFTLTNC